MPFMQRIDNYGVALHAGHLPGYPASHGCIRLPAQFAAKLFTVTEVGTPVLVGAS
jgi:lipoprotein-anchoring transpeptidase ErfK/SrfK